MDFNDLKFNPEFKAEYVLTLNNGIGHKRNLACYCEKHRCFVTQKQIASGNRHCTSPSKDGTHFLTAHTAYSSQRKTLKS